MIYQKLLKKTVRRDIIIEKEARQMHIYEYGKIGEAVRAKIESTKQSIQGGASSSESFSDISEFFPRGCGGMPDCSVI